MGSKEIAIIPEQAIIKPAGTPADMEDAIMRYRQLQETLDKTMPDCIQEIQGKRFRKKNYWRAVKTAFNLSVECIKEERLQMPDNDWGFLVTYRATAPNGASADGDGACTYSEKAKGRMAATLHNIRSQAHTRSFNRAVSNLCGFGEVSAEEVYQEKTHIQPPSMLKPPQKQAEMPLESQNTTKGLVQAMEVKKGEKNGKKWTLYIITVDDLKYSTFDKKLAEIATKAHQEGKPIMVEFVETEKGRNLVSITTEGEEVQESKCNQCLEYSRCEREATIDCLFYVPIEETKPGAF